LKSVALRAAATAAISSSLRTLRSVPSGSTGAAARWCSRWCRAVTDFADLVLEIKHDGYRLMARRDPVGIRLLTRRGNDWSDRSPLVVEAVNHLKVRSCLIDGEVVCCDERGLAVFHILCRRNEGSAFLYVFDLLELDGSDMRREPIEVRKATLASILRKARHGVRLNEHLEHPDGLTVCQRGLARWAWKALCPSGWACDIVLADHRIGSSSRTQPLPP
jgi:hypothetical protein